MNKLHVMPILVLVALPSHAETPADPWANVPALPTGCYLQDDSFPDQAYAATEILNAEISRQEDANAAIKQQVGEIDIMVMQQRMIELMSEYPEKAQQFMEAMQQGAQTAQQQTPELAAQAEQFNTELQQLFDAYDTELTQAMSAVKSRQEQVGAALSKSCNMDLVNQAAALQAEENQAYAGFCAKWWKSGPFHEWLGRFRQFKTEEAKHWNDFSETTKINLEMQGADITNYRATDDLKAPIEYLRRANEIFYKRRHAPVSEEPGDCEVRHG